MDNNTKDDGFSVHGRKFSGGLGILIQPTENSKILCTFAL